MGKGLFYFNLGRNFAKEGKEKYEKEKYERYECRGCGHIVKADPLRVPHICLECNSLYPFQKIKNQLQLL